ncbi:DUF4363 family protein [Pseudobacteroides cellulosolvens]|uniref:DUF4363 family protein n=1 Tax=Pseudobacteroides cellulosolvens ATCC 35603 = DSM 2933 TaxID=398512 RepID=A0A0L6JJX6_9FIRM|nr:DUF4363 family protein [Pseudobacteroides cellulosolvens]KNY25672.1 Protein of unknown function DUF4363 [Pseudobacteroides cellulosolvens ATCC 35603 = DSM 2933]
MRNRTITYGLLGIILLIFIIYFAAQRIVFPSGQPIVSHLNYIIEYAQHDKWEEAEQSVNKLLESWEKGKYLLALNYAEADYSLFLDNISRIKGGIQTKDVAETVNQSLSTLKLWENFKKFIPEP